MLRMSWKLRPLVRTYIYSCSLWRAHVIASLRDSLGTIEALWLFLNGWLVMKVQVHGLQLRAMNRAVGEEVGALFGGATMVECDDEGTTLGKCIRMRVNLDVNKPLLRWSNVNIGGTTTKILFRYEKLADLYFFCGSLDHMGKACKLYHPDGLRYYGPWLRVNGQNPTSLNEIASDLNRLDSKRSTPLPIALP